VQAAIDFINHMILDALTIFFIVAGIVLLGLNLRSWRRRTAPIAPPADQVQGRQDRGAVPQDGGRQRHVAGISDADVAASRARAQECLEQAAQATSETEKEAWLEMAARWIELIEDAERRRGGT